MRKMRARTVALMLAALMAIAAPVVAQAPTGTISGRVVSNDGLPLPGVTVSATSANLQGIRTAVTSANGDYLVPLLPPGDYTISFEIGSFQTLKEVRSIAGTQNAVVDVTMSPAAISEAITVVGQAQPFVETAQVATNFKQSLMATLPSNRTLDAVVLMAPSVHATGPRGAYTINGSQSYENLYTLNGVVITENLRGSPFTLYIEDALQETTVASAGISAEYGRFEGGVANAITKSGGNTFSGSFRTSFGNDSWRSYTPFEATQLTANPALKLKIDKTVPTYEGTIGGPVKRERLWFFGAGRKQAQETTRTTSATNIAYPRTNDEERYEAKLTYTARPGHSVQGSYLKLDQVLRNNSGFPVMDLKSLTDQGQPQDLYSVHYTGVLRPNVFVEAQYSARHLSFTDTGATTRDLIEGTTILDIPRNFRYWSPTFCSGSTCDGNEERNNSDIVLKGSYFLSDRAAGSHHIVFGYDRYNDNIKANTHVTGSDFRIRATNSIIRPDGTIYPQFIPGTSSTSTVVEWAPIDVLSEGSNLRTHSLFVNDSWRWNSHFSFGLGLRLDKSQATDGGGTNVGDQASWSPRLSAIWDPMADGRWAVTGSYARYVMALTSNLAGATTAAGNPANYRWFYQGPAINADANSPLLATDQALRQLFNWFNENGGTGRRPYASASVPGVNMKMLEPLKSPYSHEYAGGVSRALGSRGTVRMDGIFREYRNFYSLRTDLSTGKVTDAVGNNFDLSVMENTDAVRRRYAGMVTQVSYNFGEMLALGGNYTLSRTYGNLDGETVNQGPSGASIKSYPEYRQAAWNFPEGDLAIDQRHRARVWGTYMVPLAPSAGMVTLGLVQQIGSGAPYGAVNAINPTSFVANPGYVTPPVGVEYYFTARDAFRTETTYRTDLAVNYSYRLPLDGAQPELFAHAEVLNLFNQFQLCGCGDTVFTNGGNTNLTTIGTAVRVINTAPFNPFMTQPVRGVNWDYNANFGTPLNAFAYTSPRIFRFSVGVRF
jgi:carboxypeptidase family protein